MPIDWSILKPPTGNDYLGPLQAMQAGRQAALDTRRATATQQALQQYSAGDLEGAQRTAIAGGALDIADKVREAQARGAAGQVIGLYGTPGGAPTSFAPPSPAQALITAGTPVTAPQQALAPTFQQAFSGDFTNAPLPGSAGAPSLPGAAPVGADRVSSPLQQPVSALTDHTHDTAVQIGHAVVSGQPVEPTQAWAKLYSLDPAMGDKMMAAVSSMDKLRRDRTDETQTALGSAANTLLNTPPEQRAAAAQQMLPMLSQHGVTADMLTPQNLTDDALKGVIGQALGLKGAIEQANKQVDQQREQFVAETGRMGAVETGRHNRAAETTDLIQAHKGILDAYGNVIDPLTGGVIHDADGGSGAVSPNAAGYASALEKAGFSKNTVAGIVGNLQAESGFDPSRVGDNGQARGVAQWHPDRAAAFQKQFGVPPEQGNPLQVAAFIKSEISALPRRQQNAILNAPDPASAAAAFDQYFERSNGQTRAQRMAAAQSWANGGAGAATGGGHRLSDDAAASAAAIYIKTGQLPAGIARTRGDVDKVLNVAAQMQKAVGSKPGDIVANWQDYKSQGKAVSAFASGKQGDQVRSLNVATDHLAAAASVIHALNNGDVRLFNKLGNSLAAATGSTAPTDFNALKGFVTDEVNKAILGGSGGVGDRQEAHAILDAANSPAQLYSAVGKLQRLMAGQIEGLRQQYKVSAGRDDFDKFLSPGTKAVVSHFHPATSGQPAALPGGFKIIGRTAK